MDFAGKLSMCVGMATDDDIDAEETDLAQLLVREAGRRLEDLTPELAMRLPDQADDAAAILDQFCNRLAGAEALLRAAFVVISPRMFRPE